ncbi:hypothetical protein BGZ83_002705 [Gryganskiella cystojenkinii]|nr:hypothetical protein BGZ83_002705 [Gryganskiella cystojenkinii]
MTQTPNIQSQQIESLDYIPLVGWELDEDVEGDAPGSIVVDTSWLSVTTRLTEELKDFVRCIGPTEEEHAVRNFAFRLIEKTIKEVWPSCTVHMYGSYRTKMYLPTSDMDMVVHRDTTITLDDMRYLATHLEQLNLGPERIRFIEGAKVPLLKFHERNSRLAIDISFNHSDGIHSGDTANKHLDETPGVRPLMFILKQFLMIHRCNNPAKGGIGSYTLMIMIVSFLQMHSSVRTAKIDPEENLGVLLIEFLELYGRRFNFSKVGISITGQGSYFRREQAHRGGGGAGTQQPRMVTLDPNDPNNNTGASVRNLRDIQHHFVRACTSLIASLRSQRQAMLSNAADRVGGTAAVQKQPMITNVVKMSSMTLSHRRRLHRVFLDGTFQRMFPQSTSLNEMNQFEEQGSTMTTCSIATTKTKKNISIEKLIEDWLYLEVEEMIDHFKTWETSSQSYDDLEALMQRRKYLIVARSQALIVAVEEKGDVFLDEDARARIVQESEMFVESKLGFLTETVRRDDRFKALIQKYASPMSMADRTKRAHMNRAIILNVEEGEIATTMMMTMTMAMKTELSHESVNKLPDGHFDTDEDMLDSKVENYREVIVISGDDDDEVSSSDEGSSHNIVISDDDDSIGGDGNNNRVSALVRHNIDN